MALTVRWTFEAEFQLDEILNYLENNWTDKETRSFFSKLEKGIRTISEHPYQQKQSLRKEGTREYQIIPKITLFYEFDEFEVIVLLLWSNRANPDFLK